MAKSKLIGMIVQTCVMVGVFLYCTTLPSQAMRFSGWAGAAFAGLGLAVFLRRLFENEPKVVIDDEGITDRRQSFGLIPWKEISSVKVQWRSAEFLGIELERPADFLSRLPRRVRWLAAFNQALGYFPIVIGFTGLTPGLDEVCSYLQAQVHQRNLTKIGTS